MTLRSEWLAAVVVLFVVILGFVPRFEVPVAPMDEGTLLVHPEMVLHGALPYRDFESFYGPANELLLAAVYRGFGTNVFVERTVGLLYRTIILLAIFAIGRRWNPVAAGGAMFVAGCLLYDTNLAAYAWIGGIACALASIWMMGSSRGRYSCACAGVLAGAAVLFRLDLGPAVLVASIPLLIFSKRAERMAFAAGVALALLPLGILAVAVGPHQLLTNLFVLPVLRSAPSRHLPMLSAAPFVIRLLLLHLCAAAVNVMVGVIAMRQRRQDRSGAALLALACLGAGITYQACQRLDLQHCLFAAFLSIGILPVSVATLFSFRRRASIQPHIGAISTAAVILLVAIVAQPVASRAVVSFVAAVETVPTGTAHVTHFGRSLPVPSPELAHNLGTLVEQLDTLSRPSQRLFVGPADLRRTNYCDTMLYHLMPKLRPATYFLQMNPSSANGANSRLAADIKTADWVVLNASWDGCERSNRSCENGPDAPNEVVRDLFSSVAAFGSYEPFRRKL